MYIMYIIIHTQTHTHTHTHIDDPIRGYTVRTHDHRRRLQGFIWFTTFTSWTHFFKWDSKCHAAGLRGSADKHRIRWYFTHTYMYIYMHYTHSLAHTISLSHTNMLNIYIYIYTYIYRDSDNSLAWELEQQHRAGPIFQKSVS